MFGNAARKAFDHSPIASGNRDRRARCAGPLELQRVGLIVSTSIGMPTLRFERRVESKDSSMSFAASPRRIDVWYAVEDGLAVFVLADLEEGRVGCRLDEIAAANRPGTAAAARARSGRQT